MAHKAQWGDKECLVLHRDDESIYVLYEKKVYAVDPTEIIELLEPIAEVTVSLYPAPVASVLWSRHATDDEVRQASALLSNLITEAPND